MIYYLHQHNCILFKVINYWVSLSGETTNFSIILNIYFQEVIKLRYYARLIL